MPLIEINEPGNLLYYYWEAVTVILKLALPMMIGLVCVFLAVWGIAISRRKRVALIHNSATTSNSVVSLGRLRSSIGDTAGGKSKNTKVVILLCGIYFLLCLPSIIEYLLINTGSISCTMNFVALLANDLFIPIAHSSLFTRIFDGLIFMVIPEFRAAILNILHFKFFTKVSWSSIELDLLSNTHVYSYNPSKRLIAYCLTLFNICWILWVNYKGLFFVSTVYLQ